MTEPKYTEQQAKERLDWSLFHKESKQSILKCGVYAMHHISFPNTFYVGGTKTVFTKKYKEYGFISRWRHHVCDLKMGIHFNLKLQKNVNEFGLNGIRFKILEICTPEKVTEREDYYIAQYAKNHNIYNAYERSNALGAKYSAERIKKTVDAKIIKPIYKFDFNGNLLNIHIKHSDFVGNETYKKNIWNCLNGFAPSAYGFYWSYENKFFDKRTKLKQIIQLDLNGNVVKEHASFEDAEKYVNGNKSCISSAIYGRIKTSAGYMWKFK